MEQVHRTVEAGHKIGAEMLAIAPGTPIDLDLSLQSVSEGVLVTGTVSGDTTGQCARCLEPINGTVNVYLTELFAYPGSETEATTDEEEVYRITGDLIDLEQAVNDVVGLELPLVPLCSEDCPGLCPDCGIRLAVAEAGHHHDKIDPRWAKLADKLGPAEEDSK
jgi:uncharacterized protein